MPRTVHVAAPSRLHFGLWSLAASSGRQFGGVGAMIQQPGLELSIQPAEKLTVAGPLSDRALAFAGRWAEFHRLPLPECRITVTSALPEHAGLGTGTQLGLAVAAGLNAFCGLPPQTAPELALSVGRGLRSAVGTYGFVLGGLVVEQGKLPGEPISPLDCRIDLPAAWRFVLIRPAGLAGLAGDDEAAAIEALPAIPADVTARLIAEVRDHLVPAAATADFPTFAASPLPLRASVGAVLCRPPGRPLQRPGADAACRADSRVGRRGSRSKLVGADALCRPARPSGCRATGCPH